jgi:hypothetical protein
MAGHELPGRGLSTVLSRLSGIALYDIPTTTTGVVTHCGRICLGHKKFNFGTVPSSPARPSASKKSTATSGWSALWIMILGYSPVHRFAPGHFRSLLCCFSVVGFSRWQSEPCFPRQHHPFAAYLHCGLWCGAALRHFPRRRALRHSSRLLDTAKRLESDGPEGPARLCLTDRSSRQWYQRLRPREL